MSFWDPKNTIVCRLKYVILISYSIDYCNYTYSYIPDYHLQQNIHDIDYYPANHHGCVVNCLATSK